MSPGRLKGSSASWTSVGSFQLLVSSLVAGVVPVISDKTAQLRLLCQSVCRASLYVVISCVLRPSDLLLHLNY